MSEKLPTLSALVSIHHCKSHDFLFVVKKVNVDSDEAFLPRIPKAVVKQIIKSPGLYNIIYRLYENKDGYDSIFVKSAQKVVTK
jgi:hypothetical protein